MKEKGQTFLKENLSQSFDHLTASFKFIVRRQQVWLVFGINKIVGSTHCAGTS